MPTSMMNVGTMKVVELKEALKTRGLSTDGLKADLSSRLRAAIDAEADANEEEETTGIDDDDDDDGGVDVNGEEDAATSTTTRKRKSDRSPTRSKKSKADDEDPVEEEEEAVETTKDEGAEHVTATVVVEEAENNETDKETEVLNHNEEEEEDKQDEDVVMMAKDDDDEEEEEEEISTIDKPPQLEEEEHQRHHPSSNNNYGESIIASVNHENNNNADDDDGVPRGLSVAISAPIDDDTSAPLPPSSTSTTTNGGGGGGGSDEIIIEEQGSVSTAYVGRVIGKGGEMIRDLQARSGCRIDVDQNVPIGEPRIITYRGIRSAIDFAKQLVTLLCTDTQGKDAIELPLGKASIKVLQIPGNVIGKIIGRGGDMIRRLQNESLAKIQVNHNVGQDGDHRQVTITGNDTSIAKAEEMISFLCANPAMDSVQALEILMQQKQQRGGGGTGPTMATAYQPLPHGSSSGGGIGGIESEIFFAAKMFMGRIIGQRGITINDLQKRSGCDIQTKQNVPIGQDCEVSIKGSRQGIELAKQMLREIIDMGPNHPYAGGHGSFGGGGMGGGGYQQGHYQQQHQPYQQQQQQPYQDPYRQPAAHHQQQQPQYGGQYAVYPQQGQQQQPYAPMQQYGMPQQPGGMMQHPPQPLDASPWRTATAADGQVYYYNQITQETQWDRPAGM